MDAYVCDGCGYYYDPKSGDEPNAVGPGIPFEERPQNWVCPDCGAGKERFYLMPDMAGFEEDDLDDMYVYEEENEAF